MAPTGRVKPSPHFCLLYLPFRQENARTCNQACPQPAVSAAGSSHCSASVPTKCEVLSCKLLLSNKLLMKLLPDRLQSQGALGNSAPPPKCSNTCIYLKNICLLFPMTLQLLSCCLLQEHKCSGFLQTGESPFPTPHSTFHSDFGI